MVVTSATQVKPCCESLWSQKKYNIATVSRTVGVWTLHILAFLFCFPLPLCSLILKVDISSICHSLSACFGKWLWRHSFLFQENLFLLICTSLGGTRSNSYTLDHENRPHETEPFPMINSIICKIGLKSAEIRKNCVSTDLRPKKCILVF